MFFTDAHVIRKSKGATSVHWDHSCIGVLCFEELFDKL